MPSPELEVLTDILVAVQAIHGHLEQLVLRLAADQATYVTSPVPPKAPS